VGGGATPRRDTRRSDATPGSATGRLNAATNDVLDAWFRKQGYNTKDQEYDVIYVNGHNNLENLRKPDQTWKVRIIEEEFLRRMFDLPAAPTGGAAQAGVQDV
jgi:hypothetical protein